jgi:hypothetical protein
MFSFLESHVKSCCSKNCLLILIVVSRAYASFAVLVPLLRWLLVIKLLMWCLNLLIFKVALGVDSVTVAKIILAHLKLQNLLMRVWEAAVWILCDCLKFWILMCLLILIGYFIWSSALLCCFELLMYWWRNRWVESYWYKIFLYGNDVFGCFEELFFAEVLFDVFNVSALSKFC